MSSLQLNPSEVTAIRENERRSELAQSLRFCAITIDAPLYLAFWAADLIYAPHLKWEFLVMRLLNIPVLLFVYYAAGKAKTLPAVQTLGVLLIASNSLWINLMILMTEPGTSVYVTGLHLVCVGLLSFVPFSGAFFLLGLASVYLPFYVIAVLAAGGRSGYWDEVAIHSFFIAGFSIAAAMIRMFHERLRKKELAIKAELQRELLARRRAESEVVRLSEQVAHDIRSPLAALEVALRSMSDTSPSEHELVSAAAARIRSMAAELKGRKKNDQVSSILQCVEQVVSEKRLELSSRPGLRLELHKDEALDRLGVCVPTQDFMRVISNLINNAAEAIGEHGEIRVQVGTSCDSQAEIRIVDTGTGMSKEVLQRLGQRGFSVGKEQGSGLGIFHAMETIARIGGVIRVSSEEGKGTEVCISLPACLEGQTPADAS